MSTSGVVCTLNAVGNCAHDYTALPGDELKFELFLQNNGQEPVEYSGVVKPPIALPASAVGEPAYVPFGDATGTLEDCIVLECGACMSVCWEVTLPEDAYCKAVTLGIDLTRKTDEVETIVKKNLKTGTAQVEVPVKPEVKQLVSQTIAVGVQVEDLKSCPNTNGYRSNDGTAITQWMSAGWDDTLAACFADACDSGLSFMDVLCIKIAGVDVEVLLDKNAIAEGIQGVDLDGDGKIGALNSGSASSGKREAEQLADDKTGDELQDMARALGLPTSGTKLEIAQRIVEAN